jgi:hypothetical protein
MAFADLQSRRCSAEYRTHGHLEQSGMHLQIIEHERGRYKLLGSITHAMNEHESIQQQFPGSKYFYLDLVTLAKQRSVAAAA